MRGKGATAHMVSAASVECVVCDVLVCRVCWQVPATQGCDAAQLGEMCNDDLAHIGSRYGVSLSDLLWWNPDLQGAYVCLNPVAP